MAYHQPLSRGQRTMRYLISIILAIVCTINAFSLSAQTSKEAYDGSQSDMADTANQSDNDEDGPRKQRFSGQSSSNTWGISPNLEVEAQASLVAQNLAQIQKICEDMGDEYRVACFAVTYKDLANALQRNGGDEIIRSTLHTAARKLDQLVQNNLDREKPALRAYLTDKSGEKLVTTRSMDATAATRTAALKIQAAEILEEAETVLLRSASSTSPTRALSYQKVAAAIGSNKILLRST